MSCSVWIGSIALSPGLLIRSSASFSLLLNPLVYFPVQLLYSSALGLLFGYFFKSFISLLKFTLCSCFLLLGSVSIFILSTVTLNSVSSSLLIFISLRSYLWFYLVLSLEHTPVSSLGLTFCVCFYVLSKRVPLPVMKKWLCVGDEPYPSTLP